MPYTNVWSVSVPVGSLPANQIDSAIQQVRLDIAQRLEGALIESMSTDPVVAKAAITGKVVGKKILFGPHIFMHRDTTDDGMHENTYVQTDNDKSAVASLNFPQGVTITKVDVYVDKLLSTNVDFQLQRVAVATGTGTDVETTSSVGVGIHIISSGNMAYVVNDTEVVLLRIGFTGGITRQGRIYGVRVTYNTPDSTALY